MTSVGEVAPTIDFHVYKDVAPLKPLLVIQGMPSFSNFHVYKDVAPLKQVRGGYEYFYRNTDFHVYKDVAPLKLGRS